MEGIKLTSTVISSKYHSIAVLATIYRIEFFVEKNISYLERIKNPKDEEDRVGQCDDNDFVKINLRQLGESRFLGQIDDT